MPLTLLIDPGQPTRIGNSVSLDTCPYLTMARGTAAVICSRPLDETEPGQPSRIGLVGHLSLSDDGSRCWSGHI
ncbi:hypothetical protein HPB50_015347 [Hyalomma asiaticum]|uniref:Uncharacterized protein n=1 Tax=Hyalomma asiaticum TaxID=266040 RepID=A0ACB7SVJ9_HYAAI|nr:hypothetical protein HPB50_015347 [Hyalomma asiaticum]